MRLEMINALADLGFKNISCKVVKKGVSWRFSFGKGNIEYIADIAQDATYKAWMYGDDGHVWELESEKCESPSLFAERLLIFAFGATPAKKLKMAMRANKINTTKLANALGVCRATAHLMQKDGFKFKINHIEKLAVLLGKTQEDAFNLLKND